MLRYAAHHAASLDLHDMNPHVSQIVVAVRGSGDR
jgi:hypothetical protein